MRYLKLLPELVIPFNTYEQFTAAVDSEVDLNFDQRIVTLQGLVATLPPLSQQLLMYLLDLLSMFVLKSESNLMTSQRLVAAFQPSLLSRPPSEMSADDHTQASDTMVFIVENQDKFMIGIRGANKERAAETQTKPAETPVVQENVDLPLLRRNMSDPGIRREQPSGDGGAGFARPGSSASRIGIDQYCRIN